MKRRHVVIELADPKTFWLNATNIALGLATIVLLAVGVLAAIREMARRRTHGSRYGPKTAK